MPGEARKRAYQLRDQLAGAHKALEAIGTPRDRKPEPLVTSGAELGNALAHWTVQLLSQLDIMAPGIAPGVLRATTGEQRFMLEKAGFFAQLPWAVQW